MSVTVRLARTGRRNLPSYRIVVANTRSKRNGMFLDIIGHYNPSMNPVDFAYNKEKLEGWKNKGALITSAVDKLIKGEYSFTPYRKKATEAGNPEE